MPKSKKPVSVEENDAPTKEKEILLDDEDKVMDSELIAGEPIGDEEGDEEGIADDDEVDPFKDRWEE